MLISRQIGRISAILLIYPRYAKLYQKVRNIKLIESEVIYNE